jgi:hypothetical protein
MMAQQEQESKSQVVALAELAPLRGDMQVSRAPEVVLEEAQNAARALKSVIDKRPDHVTFGGKQYLTYEDWQTVGRFYGLTAKVERTASLTLDGAHGFEARALAVNAVTGVAVSAAEAMCMQDEPNWQKKPLYQLRSMAQTRACAKALRNALAWVVVLAGYQPTPAEEMDSMPPADKPKSIGANNEMCQFGKNKGVRWADMELTQLQWYADYLTAQLSDPSKKKYAARNKAIANTIAEIIDSRESAAVVTEGEVQS